MTSAADLTGQAGNIQLDTIWDLRGGSMGYTEFGIGRQDEAFLTLVTIGFGPILIQTVIDKSSIRAILSAVI
jgi:hypothetical protein